jgi:hypothetical protein
MERVLSNRICRRFSQVQLLVLVAKTRKPRSNHSQRPGTVCHPTLRKQLLITNWGLSFLILIPRTH